MNGEYKEKLPFGQGDLIVTKNDFYIQFYFPGPDMRYNGTFLKIDSYKIDSYVTAYRNNWNKYIELKDMQTKLANEFSLTGELGMKISIGGWINGICIDSYHMPLDSEKKINNVIDSFSWAKQRGSEIKNFLKSL
ncbi:MAG: hypothetical protein A2066_00790 [Bacteroidetes bacterium GWB2_41_8]|nr:MAG: hypothetical protein A2066_00790 [Bacteroidetes bacterium GWB2_41_8]